MRMQRRGGVCPSGCWPNTSGTCDCDYATSRARTAKPNLGFITNEITMSLGDGLVLGGSVPLGFITPNITTMLGRLGEEPTEPGSSGKVVFWALSFGLGIALGAAFGISHGVKIGRTT